MTIKLKLPGRKKPVEMTMEEAKELFEQLSKVFASPKPGNTDDLKKLRKMFEDQQAAPRTPVFVPVYREPPPIRRHLWEGPFGPPMCEDRDMFRVNPDHLPTYSTMHCGSLSEDWHGNDFYPSPS